MERHSVVGEQILAPVAFLAGARRFVRHEHERYDGVGYPDGLAGHAIPLGARIILACDALHAMTSDRPYRRAMSFSAACEELRVNAGTQFDPQVVSALLDLLARVEPRGIETSLVIDAPLEKLSPDITGLLYRAAQEGLRNVVSHAEAGRVDVSVTQTGDMVAVEVSDDGRGMSRQSVDGDHDGHFGLRALAGLSATMGGTLTIDSTPGKGTTMCLEVRSR